MAPSQTRSYLHSMDHHQIGALVAVLWTGSDALQSIPRHPMSIGGVIFVLGTSVGAVSLWLINRTRDRA
jgi:hypothetical protein